MNNEPHACPWKGSYNEERAAEIADMEDPARARLVGFATTATPGAAGFAYYDAKPCATCALVDYRRAHPRKRKGYAVFIEADYPGSRRRMFSRAVTKL